MADKPISQLPALPGNATLDTLLAVVQAGVTYKAEINDILNTVSITTGANGTMLRIPGPNFQICFHRLQAVHVGSAAYLRIPEWHYPQAFAEIPIVLLQNVHTGSTYGPLPDQINAPLLWTGASASEMGNARIYTNQGSFAAGNVINVNAVAIGTY